MNTEKKNKLSRKHWIIIGSIALAVILAVALILFNRNEGKDRDWSTVIPGQTQGEQPGEETRVNGEQDPIDPEAPRDTETAQTDTEGADSGDTPTQNTNPIPTLGDEDPYEDWLAAAMIVGISMQYSDYEFLGIYTASETPISAHDSSAGAYVIFNGDGEKLALKCVPISAERADRGTADLYVPAIGYATYELVEASSVPVNSLKERKLEDLVDMISASAQVTIIER